MKIRDKILELLPPLVIVPTDKSNKCEGHYSFKEDLSKDDKRIDWFRKDTIIIGMDPKSDNNKGGSLEINFDVSSLPDSLISADLKITTFRTHGGIHAPQEEAEYFHKKNGDYIKGRLYINNKQVDNIDLVKEMPHGKDFGFNRLEPYPIVKWIKEVKRISRKLKIKLDTDPDVLWDVDEVSIENIVNETKRIKPVIIMIIGAVIGIIGSAIATLLLNSLFNC